MEPIGQGSYLLVKVAMDVGEDRWFQSKLPGYGQPGETEPEKVSRDRKQERAKGSFPENGGRGGEGKKTLTARIRGSIFHNWISMLGENRRRRNQEHRLKLCKEAFQQACGQVEAGIGKLVRQIGEFVEDWQECRCVYDVAVRKWLVSEGSIPRLWHKHWDVPEFADFFELGWVTPLLSAARLPHFVILGTAPCVPEVIITCADRMRSLRWVLREADMTQEIQDFIEDFYLDYGLAVTLQTLEGNRGFHGYGCSSQGPVCVLDFSGEERIRTGAVARGSVWLDMASQEKKEHCFLGRDSGVAYGSIRKSWREARRRAPDWAAIVRAERARPKGEQLPEWLRGES